MNATKETTIEATSKTGTYATRDQKKSSLTPTPTSSAKDSRSEIDLVANT